MKISGNFEVNVTTHDEKVTDKQTPQADENGHFDLTFFQVVHDIVRGARRCSYVPLGQRHTTSTTARRELDVLKRQHPDAYLTQHNLFFSLHRSGDLDEYNRLKGTILSEA